MYVLLYVCVCVCVCVCLYIYVHVYYIIGVCMFCYVCVCVCVCVCVYVHVYYIIGVCMFCYMYIYIPQIRRGDSCSHASTSAIRPGCAPHSKFRFSSFSFSPFLLSIFSRPLTEQSAQKKINSQWAYTRNGNAVRCKKGFFGNRRYGNRFKHYSLLRPARHSGKGKNII